MKKIILVFILVTATAIAFAADYQAPINVNIAPDGLNGAPVEDKGGGLGLDVNILSGTSITAAISGGTVTANVVSIPSITVISIPSVTVTSMPTVTVNISSQPSTTVISIPSVTVISMPSVTIISMPSLTAVAIASMPSLTVISMPSITVSSMPTTTIQGTVGIISLPSVTIVSVPTTTTTRQLSSTNSTSQITVTNSATLIKASNVSRQSIIIRNQGAADMYIGTSGVTIANGLLVKRNEIAVLDNTTAAWYGIVSSGTTTAGYAEE